MADTLNAGTSGSGPPFSTKYAQLGGLPTNDIDTPIAAVFLVMYIGAAVGNMTLLQLNNRRKHKFLLSGMMFGYCMSRIVTMSLRISWANFPTNIRLALAANIFTAAGVLLLYIVNLIFSQRLIRSRHPTLGWSRPFHYAFVILYTLIPLLLIMIIISVIQMVYTLSPRIHTIDNNMRLSGQCYLLLVAFLPLPLMALNYALPRRSSGTPEPFGAGHERIKTAVLLTGTILLVLGAGFRVGVGFQDYYHPRSRTNPGWYHSKACFWIFDIAVEIVTVYLYLLVRVDLRFHVPNGSKRQGDYSSGRKLVGDDEKVFGAVKRLSS